ncbi:hypothetical protein SAMN02745947_05476 [Rhodococcus rhodochrous J3]|uniref:Uncharacterized protein n=1 Tax=Rhodococcus rhodochrous J3 TaxID=903528 RepID=A0ABY1MLN1_RHORH|nr:hypothetical protein SAMN02745947_05476 [Rhodococcus rhodochrous J3]
MKTRTRTADCARPQLRALGHSPTRSCLRPVACSSQPGSPEFKLPRDEHQFSWTREAPTADPVGDTRTTRTRVHPTRMQPESPRDPCQLTRATRATRDRPWRWCAQRRRHAGPCPLLRTDEARSIRHRPATHRSQRFTPGLLDAVSPGHGVVQRPTPSESPRSPSLPASTARRGRVLLHDVLVGDFVYGHTCTRSALVHPRRPLCDSRTSRAVRSRASAVLLPASNVRRRRLLRFARCPPSSALRARCRCKMAHGTPGTVDTDLPFPPP